jgi:hypothetical protein
MADHPRSLRREGLCSASLSRGAAPARWPVGVTRRLLGLVRGSLVGRKGGPTCPAHIRNPRRPHHRPRCRDAAIRAFIRLKVFSHWALRGEDAAGAAGIVVNWHPHRSYKSGASGSVTPGLTILLGPEALGRISKSKISVGKYKVAQAFGMSTTPLMCPWTGAVPRIV